MNIGSLQEKEKMLGEVWNAVAQRSKTQMQEARNVRRVPASGISYSIQYSTDIK